MPYLIHHYDKDSNRLNSHRLPGCRRFGKKVLGSHKGYKIILRYKDSQKFVTDLVAVTRTGRVHIEIEGSMRSDGGFSVTGLCGSRVSRIKAHEVYAYAATKLPYILSSSSHSPGGYKVWERVGKNPKIRMKLCKWDYSHVSLNNCRYEFVPLNRRHWEKNYEVPNTGTFFQIKAIKPRGSKTKRQSLSRKKSAA